MVAMVVGVVGGEERDIRNIVTGSNSLILSVIRSFCADVSPLVPGVNTSLLLCNKREKRQAAGRGRSGKRGRGNNRKKNKKNKNKKNNKNSIPVTRNIPKGNKCSNTGMNWNSYHPTNTIDRFNI